MFRQIFYQLTAIKTRLSHYRFVSYLHHIKLHYQKQLLNNNVGQTTMRRCITSDIFSKKDYISAEDAESTYVCICIMTRAVNRQPGDRSGDT